MGLKQSAFMQTAAERDATSNVGKLSQQLQSTQAELSSTQQDLKQSQSNGNNRLLTKTASPQLPGSCRQVISMLQPSAFSDVVCISSAKFTVRLIICLLALAAIAFVRHVSNRQALHRMHASLPGLARLQLATS